MSSVQTVYSQPKLEFSQQIVLLSLTSLINWCTSIRVSSKNTGHYKSYSQILKVILIDSCRLYRALADALANMLESAGIITAALQRRLRKVGHPHPKVIMTLSSEASKSSLTPAHLTFLLKRGNAVSATKKPSSLLLTLPQTEMVLKRNTRNRGKSSLMCTWSTLSRCQGEGSLSFC